MHSTLLFAAFAACVDISIAAAAGVDAQTLSLITLVPKPPKSTPTQPCRTTIWNRENSMEIVKTPDCYTYTTSTTPSECRCTMAPEVMCPMYIKVTTVGVPCHNTCCPKTPTKTVKACPTMCNPKACTIPTETYYTTTGCPKKPDATPV